MYAQKLQTWSDLSEQHLSGARVLLDFIYQTDAGKPRPTM
jgi:hypothetical protein